MQGELTKEDLCAARLRKVRLKAEADDLSVENALVSHS